MSPTKPFRLISIKGKPRKLPRLLAKNRLLVGAFYPLMIVFS